MITTEHLKTIWIINLDASTPETGYAGRSYYLSEELARRGHKVYLIAGSFVHLHRNSPQVTDSYLITQESNFSFVWVKVAQYSHAHSKKRIWNWFHFAYQLRGLTRIIEDRPDVIICSSPPLTSFLGAHYLSKYYRSKLIFEIRDIWPLTLIELGGFSKNHPFIRLMQWIESKAYRTSDVIISNLMNASAHLENNNVDVRKFHWIPNGYSQIEVSGRLSLPDDIIKKIPQGKFIVGYTGTLGFANAMEIFVQAGLALKENKDIVLVLVGDGREKENLMRLAASTPNIVFIEPIHKKMIQSMLYHFDACYIGWRNHSIYQFGIGANKIPEYLFSGKPIIHSYSGTMDPIERADAGIQVPAEDVEALVNAIKKLHAMSLEERANMGRRGTEYAIEYFEYRSIAKKLEKLLY